MKTKLFGIIAFFMLPYVAAAQVQTDAAGNVGIGTANPLGRFHVYEPSSAHVYSILQRSNNAYHAFSQYLPAGVISPANPIWLAGMKQSSADYEIHTWDGTTGSSRLHVKTNGNVGIGTTAPTEKLDVAGTARAQRFVLKDNWDNILGSEDNGNTHHLIGTYRGWDPKAIYIAGVNAGNPQSGYTTATEKVYIGNPFHNDRYVSVNLMHGGVGIGTTNTSDVNYRLFVEKGIRTRKIRVDQTTWADYVFEPTYQLPSLTEVEAFIKTHKHLPDVPSQKEVEENGLDLGDNQAILLKKIEELTLYVIEVNKKVEQLQQENRQLREEHKSRQSKQPSK